MMMGELIFRINLWFLIISMESKKTGKNNLFIVSSWSGSNELVHSYAANFMVLFF